MYSWYFHTSFCDGPVFFRSKRSVLILQPSHWSKGAVFIFLLSRISGFFATSMSKIGSHSPQLFKKCLQALYLLCPWYTPESTRCGGRITCLLFDCCISPPSIAMPRNRAFYTYTAGSYRMCYASWIVNRQVLNGLYVINVKRSSTFNQLVPYRWQLFMRIEPWVMLSGSLWTRISVYHVHLIPKNQA